MQFLVSLVRFADGAASPGASDPVNNFTTVDYWPDAFTRTAGVILHRDVSTAEKGNPDGGRVGGVQTFSYLPEPLCNRSEHWESTQQWLAGRGLGIETLLGQYFMNDYLYHYSIE